MRINEDLIDEIIDLLWRLEGAVECEPSSHKMLRDEVESIERRLRELREIE